jgi:hypothetical protein
MSITLITPHSQGGVTDFADRLVENLAAEQPTTAFALEQGTANTIVGRESSSECLYLQYSGYGYAKRGAPFWLLKHLQTNRTQIKTLGVFFHELYAFGPPWGSAFWLSSLQRHIARRLAEQSDFWMTNREESAKWLRRFAGNKPHAVLPVFSTIGELESYSVNRTPKVIVFGGEPLRYVTYQAAGNELFTWAKQQGLEIHDIGPSIKDPILSNRLSSEGVIVHGKLPHIEISRLMADAMFGLVAYSVEYAAKSSVFAAYCAHGICPVLISQHYGEADGLIQRQHYLPGIPKTQCTPTIAADIGQTAWNWYLPHRLASHIAVLNKLLGEVNRVC